MPWAAAHRRALALLLSFALTLLALLLGRAAPAFAATSLTAHGSSWAGPAIEKWRTDVADRGITISFTPNGSAAGRIQWEGGLDDFTASDVPFRTKEDTGASQSDRGGGKGSAENPVYDYSYVPITAGGTAFMYNLVVGGKQVTDLRLSADNLVDIFTGKITFWDDPKITAEYGRALPHLRVTPVVRSDGSGASAQFTRWMEHTHKDQWDAYCTSINNVTCGDYTEFFPANPNQMIAQPDSSQVAHYIEQPAGLGAIGYDEYAFALTSNWPVVKVRNPAGYYSLPTASNVAVALTKATIRGVDDNTSPDDPNFLQQNLDGVYSNGDPRSYPVSSYSYVIVPRNGGTKGVPPRFNDSKGAALSQYLSYVLCAGQRTGDGGIDSIGYSPLPRGLVRGGLLQVGHVPGDNSGVDPNTLKGCANPTFDESGNLTILANAPQPNRCDLAGMPLTCDRSGGGAGSTAGSTGGSTGGSSGGSTGGAGSGGSTSGGASSGGGSGTGGTGATGGAKSSPTKSGAGGGSGSTGSTGTGGSGTGTDGGNGTGTGDGTGGTGGDGSTAGTTDGTTPAGGDPAAVDPQTGEQLAQGGGSGGSGGAGAAIAANVVNIGGRPQDWTLTTLTALEVLAVVAVPPFLGGWLRRRRQADGTTSGGSSAGSGDSR